MSDETAPPTIGIVLAGGLARRMGGGDKGLRLVGGRTILARVAERMAPQCRDLFLGANGDPARFAETGLAVLPDPLPDHPGPLAGILAGLDWAAERRPGVEWVASVAGDCPFLPRDLVARLHAARAAEGAALALAASGGRVHPVNALWPVALRGALRLALAQEGLRKVGAFAARHPHAVAQWPTEPADPFFNANTADDLAEAGRLAALLDGR